MLDPFEASPGLVAFLDPVVLAESGARVVGPVLGRVRSPHHFICTEVRGTESDWLPTSSKPASGRVLVGRKWGHPAWCNTDTYADILQVWTLEGWMLRPASRLDLSQRGSRNRASLQFLFSEAAAAA
jgi:hypothetical protein